MYGAERWILALSKNLDSLTINSVIAVPLEGEKQAKVVDQFRRAGQEVKTFEIESRFSPRAITKLCRLIRELDIDIIHSHGYKSDILGLIAAKITGAKSVSTPHGFGEPKSLKHKSYIWLGKFFLRFFDMVAPLSLQLEAEVAAAGVPGHRVSFIRNAVDLDEIEEYRSQNINHEDKKKLTIGYVGQIIPRKKIDHILEIFERVWTKNSSLDLVILGDGESRQSMQEYAGNLASSESIHFLGFREDRLQLLSEFDLFVMTSSDEGIPRCMMEAIAMGIPVAAYDIAGIDQLIKNEQTGLLANYGDKDCLQAHWEKLLYDRKLARKMADDGRQLLVENYYGHRMATDYTMLYQTLVSARG